VLRSFVFKPGQNVCFGRIGQNNQNGALVPFGGGTLGAVFAKHLKTKYWDNQDRTAAKKHPAVRLAMSRKIAIPLRMSLASKER